MKKLMMLAAVCCFIAVSCNTKPAETPAPAGDETTTQKEDAGCTLTEEQKAECAAWKDWANQTPEKKAELVKNAIEKINAKRVEMEAKKAEMEAKKAEMDAKWATIDQLGIEEQKALIDEMMACCKPCCKKQKEGCCAKKAEEGCNKENATK